MESGIDSGKVDSGLPFEDGGRAPVYPSERGKTAGIVPELFQPLNKQKKKVPLGVQKAKGPILVIIFDKSRAWLQGYGLMVLDQELAAE
jgi:hypothetical protein